MTFAVDPLNPTGAELSAAIERGLADGTLIDAADWMDRQREAERIQHFEADHAECENGCSYETRAETDARIDLEEQYARQRELDDAAELEEELEL